MLTREQFFTEFRGRMLLFATESWCFRKETPTAVGSMLDDHTRKMKALMDEMYDYLAPKPEPKPPPKPTVNSQPAQPQRKVP